MNDLRFHVLSCIEHERLAFDLLELRTRGQYLVRFRTQPAGAGRMGLAGTDGAVAAGGSRTAARLRTLKIYF